MLLPAVGTLDTADKDKRSLVYGIFALDSWFKNRSLTRNQFGPVPSYAAKSHAGVSIT